MNKSIEIFNHPRFDLIRVVVLPDGQKGFVGKDVAEALGYKNASKAICDHVNEDDKTTLLIQQSGSNYKSSTTIINESGLYALIFSSKLKQAQEFKHWVTSEVLPQIRRTGGYIHVSSEDDDSTIMAKALIVAQKTIEQKDRLIEAWMNDASELKATVSRQQEEMAFMLPKVEFSDRVSACENSIYVGEMAKILRQNGVEIGRTRFFNPATVSDTVAEKSWNKMK